MTRLSSYPEYNDPDLPWLGPVPAHWDVVRTKHLFRLRLEISPPKHGMELLSCYTHIGVKPRKDMVAAGNKATTTDGYWIVRRGDIIVNKLLAWMGAVGVSHYEGVTSPAYDILKPVCELNSDFYHYLFRTPIYRQQFKARSRGIMEMRLRLYFDQLGQIPCLLPPKDDQDAIVRFLLDLDNKVNRFIRNRRGLIEVLNEQKQAVINRAVTRGLDPNVHLKPSGIDWLGDLPEHWDVRRLRNVAELRVSNIDKHTREGEFPVRLCNYTDVYKNSVITADMPFMAATATRDELEAFRLSIGDVIITKDSEDWQDIGVPALVTQTADDLVCGYHLAILRPRLNVVTGHFLSYALQCRGVVAQLSLSANGVTRYGLSHGAIKAISLPTPPADEQGPIAAYIDEATSSLNKVIARATREIDLIREYRTRLIADVVTGKIDVRAVAATLPHEPDDFEVAASIEDSSEPIENEAIAEDAGAAALEAVE